MMKSSDAKTHIFKLPIQNFNFLSICIPLIVSVSFLELSFASIQKHQCVVLFQAKHPPPTQIPFDLKPSGPAVEHQTVFFDRRLNDETLVLKIKKGENWNSNFRSFESGLVPQGDPRDIIFILGEKLALQLGFKLIELENELELHVPTAKKLEELIIKMNLKLPPDQQIKLLPTESKFLTNIEILEMTVSDPDYMRFPYADKIAELVVHEISFHLSSMLYPSEFLDKAKASTKLTLDFIKFVQSKMNLDSDLNIKESLEKIIDDRAYDLDTGTGNLTLSLARLRSQYRLSYQDLFRLISESKYEFKFFKNLLESFIGFKTNFFDDLSKVIQAEKISDVDKIKLINLLNEFKQQSNPDPIVLRPYSSELMLFDFFTKLDRKLELMSDALKP